MGEDERFARIQSDPKFRSLPKHERKVKVDKRFQSMFTEKEFKLKFTTDKRGRPTGRKTSKEDLKKYYEISSDEEEEEEERGEEEELTSGSGEERGGSEEKFSPSLF